MHGSFDKSGENFKAVKDIYQHWGIGVFALPVLIVIALVGMAMTNQGASNWISEAAQAEFGNTNYRPEAAPTQLAKPGMEIRTVKVN